MEGLYTLIPLFACALHVWVFLGYDMYVDLHCVEITYTFLFHEKSSINSKRTHLLKENNPRKSQKYKITTLFMEKIFVFTVYDLKM